MSATAFEEASRCIGTVDEEVKAWAPSDKRKEKDGRHSMQQVHRKLKPYSDKPELYAAKAQMWDARKNIAVQDFLYFMLPMEIMERLAAKEDVDHYCNVDDKPEIGNQLDGWCERVGTVRVPSLGGLAIWGDMAPYNTKESICLLTWTLISGLHRKRYWLTCFSKRQMCACGCLGRHTFAAIWEVVAWCLESLMAGLFPAARHDGVPWALSTYVGDKARSLRKTAQLPMSAGLLQFRGDWAWIKQVVALIGWKDGPKSKCCWKCDANRVTGRDASTTTPWRGTHISHREYLQFVFAPQGYFCPIFMLVGFTLAGVIADFMHCSCLGVVPAMLGNVMWELYVQFGSSPEALSRLVDLIALASRQLGIEPPVRFLTALMLRVDSKAPKLKLKAAQGRYMVDVVHFILTNLVLPATPYQHTRSQCLTALWEVYKEMKDWDATRSRHIVAASARRHLILYNALNVAVGDEKRWRWYPKHHIFLEVCEEQSSSFGNIAESWSYSEESEVGIAATLAETCHSRTVHHMAMEKYTLKSM